MHIGRQLQPPDIVGFLILLPGHGWIVSLGPPQLPLDSRHYLQWIKRLCNIIVCAHSKSRDLIYVLYLRRKHNDRKIPVLPDLTAKLKTVDIRQHHIQDRQ